MVELKTERAVSRAGDEEAPRSTYSTKTRAGAVAVSLAMIVHGLYLFGRYDTKWAFAVTAVGLSVLAAVFVSAGYLSAVPRWLRRDDAPFVLSFCMSAVIFVFLFVPGAVPDEFYHFFSTYKYSDVLTGQEVSDSYISMRGDDVLFVDSVLSTKVSRESYGAVADSFSVFAEDSGYSKKVVDSTYSMTANVPQQRVPAALGIVLAKILGLGSVPLFYLGRLFNAAYSCMLIILAVRIIPIGKNVFKIVSLLPMTLHLVGSYSYDGPSLGFAFLLSALILRAIFDERRLETKDLIVIVVVAVLLAPCKAIYVLIVFLALAIPRARFADKKTEIAFKAGIVVASAGVVLLLRMSSLLMAAGASTGGDGLSYRGDEAGYPYTVHDFISQPIMAVMLFLRSFDYFGGEWITKTLGGSLGWFQEEISAPMYLNYVYLVLLLLSCVAVRKQEKALPPHIRIVLGLISAGVILAAILSMATSWTFNTDYYIYGVQGRYFLPVLPLLLLGVRPKNLVYTVDSANMLTVASTFLTMFYVCRIFAIGMSI